MAAIDIVVAVAGLAAGVMAGLRWLRVAQREHYVPGSCVRFAWRWWLRGRPANPVLAMGTVVWLAAAFVWRPAGIVAAGLVAVGPVGLGIRGRTSALVWTRRLKVLAATTAALAFVIVDVAVLLGLPLALAILIAAAAAPAFVDLGLAATQPAERRASRRWASVAEQKLRSVDPLVVAITGSYGKTSTKGYVRHLLAGTHAVVASPASFNNANGLARTVNEHLSAGTDVFVAEMGMWGPGEIRALCQWVRPTVGVVTAIGPVHLERVGSLDGIVAAKSELVDAVDIAVLNIDAHGLAELADRVAPTKTVVRVSTRDRTADVVVAEGPHGPHTVHVAGEPLGAAPADAVPTNVACAVGVAVAVGVPPDVIATRLAELPHPEHRHEVLVAASGATIVDNTFSSNPASASRSLELLASLRHPGHRAVLVTPGMVELGEAQATENRQLAEVAAHVVTDLVIVGWTNRRALLDGAQGGEASVVVVPTRQEAVAWVRTSLGPDDVVVYENDLPDHYA